MNKVISKNIDLMIELNIENLKKHIYSKNDSIILSNILSRKNTTDTDMLFLIKKMKPYKNVFPRKYKRAFNKVEIFIDICDEYKISEHLLKSLAISKIENNKCLISFNELSIYYGLASIKKSIVKNIESKDYIIINDNCIEINIKYMSFILMLLQILVSEIFNDNRYENDIAYIFNEIENKKQILDEVLLKEINVFKNDIKKEQYKLKSLKEKYNYKNSSNETFNKIDNNEKEISEKNINSNYNVYLKISRRNTFKIHVKKDANGIVLMFKYNEKVINSIKKLPFQYRHYEPHKWIVSYGKEEALLNIFIEDEIYKSFNIEELIYLITNPKDIRDNVKFKVNATNLNDDVIKLDFNYDKQIIDVIKGLPTTDRRYLVKKRAWIVSQKYIPLLIDRFKKLERQIPIDTSSMEQILQELSKVKISIKECKLNGYIDIECDKSSNNSNFLRLLDEFRILNSDKVTVPATEIDKIFNNDKLELDNSAKNLLQNLLKSKEYIERNKTYPPVNISKLKKKPYPHQLEIIEPMLKLKRFILGDEMGLGKTFESILFGASIPLLKLIVCPATLILNWKKEIEETLDKQNIVIVNSKFKKSTIKDLNKDELSNTWIVINYEKLHKYKNILKELNVGVLLCDEAHYIKSIDNKGYCTSKRGKATLDLSMNIPYKVAITGTPIGNSSKDCWNLLILIESKEVLIGFDKFKEYFKEKSIKSLNEMLSSKMIRRLKKDILNLPDIQRRFIPNEIDTRDYNLKLKEYLDNENKSLTQFIAYLNAIRLIIAKEKTTSTIKLAEMYLKEHEKIVIFTNYKEPAQKFKRHFGENAVLIDGSVPVQLRKSIIDEFQEGDKKVFIGNLKAAGTGITLTKSDIVIFNDFDYIPSSHLQAEQRIHRIGQKNNCFIVYNYASNAEIDGFMIEKLTSKFKMINQIVDGVDSEFIEEDKSITKELYEHIGIK
ncbi:hypothetical protein HMPREF1092_03256 [Clostridium thermobutyricum]|uniref:Helicase ATP-binding domain-containing protein n=1 Tax=Clostridium thermobutyricum TaxID=29372 RepID=N9XTR8_9CLOT|nr:DEAD/DEAH box helicase [Clostridium thermobutyricum]ENY99348.1 hypothetical protein HMPREF1092_03256 [Clostridium thermobutyricum]